MHNFIRKDQKEEEEEEEQKLLKEKHEFLGRKLFLHKY
jgi:hypothetical protein